MATTEFSITSAVLTLGGTAYCASEYSITSSASGNHYTCISSDISKAMVSGTGSRSGSATITYDNAGDIDSLRGAAGAGAGEITFSAVITTSNTRTITQAGNIVITSVDSSFSHGDVPTAAITWIFNGVLTEIIT